MKKTLLLTFASLLGLTSVAAVGGPDAFGYTFIDSNEPGGPVYNWIEIAVPAGGSGTFATGLVCDDCHIASIPLGFNFPFYGTNFTDISIASNGTVYFEDTYLGYSNVCIPGTPGYTMAQYNFIAHMWGDIDPSSQGGVYYQAFSNYFVIEFYDAVPCCGAGDGDSWQVILYDNGDIIMQYEEISNMGTDYFTIGIQNDPTLGLEYVCDQTGNMPSNSLAVKFTASGCAPVTVTANATETTPCEGEMITLTGTGADTYTWDNGVTDGVAFAAAAGSTTYTVTGTVTSTGCTYNATVVIDAFALPVVTYSETATTLCNYFGPVTLTEGTPAGGTFSGTGVSGGTFDPNQTVGNYDVVYTYTDGNGCSSSDTVTFAVSGCLGLNDNNSTNLEVFPNPTSGLITLNGLTAGDLIIIYNVDGKLLLSKEATNTSMSFDLSTFSSGTYILFVNDTAFKIQKN